MIYAYLRVSTDDQTCANQRLGIDALAKKHGLIIDRYIIDDGVSGVKAPNKRALGNMLRRLKPGDVVFCSEISRLGRKLFMIMEILNCMMTKGVVLYTVKDGYVLGDNIQSKVLAFAFGLVAEIERDLISQRTKEALAVCKTNGITLGRPKGSKTRVHKLEMWRVKIIKWRAKGWSKAKIARRCHCCDKTLRRWLAKNNL